MAEGIACDDAALAGIVAQLQEASFSSDKEAFMKTVCQNYCFTCAQVAAMIGTFSHSSDKLSALDTLSTSVRDPVAGAAAVVGVFTHSSDKEEAQAKLSAFSAATVREQAVFKIEDDGHRADGDMQRFIAAINAASFSSDKVAVAVAECEHHPTPPFDAAQLAAVLKCYAHSSDKVAVLAEFAGPAIVYPMTCAAIVTLLDVFPHSSDKIEVLPSLKPFIADAQNKLTIVSSFTFGSDKTKAEEILRDVVVDFRPKTPPQAAIQAALKRVGRCPAGYAWRQVRGGWRCAAGGHYVSDSTLQTAMGGTASF